ncbi:AAA family ATPase [Belliella sp. DSM 111904]|uniref:AAA family ATPase n=1 Tax=Belliella filtrata TaxID=2923435 RepID=A0ABS9UZK0_9BACT|nr:AAA family ATPase [Belliella filtrata]
MIQGPWQVGKTWLMKSFGQSEFEDVAYINLESSKELRELFESTFDLNRILLGIQVSTGV